MGRASSSSSTQGCALWSPMPIPPRMGTETFKPLCPSWRYCTRGKFSELMITDLGWGILWGNWWLVDWLNVKALARYENCGILARLYTSLRLQHITQWRDHQFRLQVNDSQFGDAALPIHSVWRLKRTVRAYIAWNGISTPLSRGNSILSPHQPSSLRKAPYCLHRLLTHQEGLYKYWICFASGYLSSWLRLVLKKTFTHGFWLTKGEEARFAVTLLNPIQIPFDESQTVFSNLISLKLWCIHYQYCAANFDCPQFKTSSTSLSEDNSWNDSSDIFLFTYQDVVLCSLRKFSLFLCLMGAGSLIRKAA